MSNLTDFCALPRTMYEIEAEGFTRDMVYGAVKRGELVNQNRKMHGEGPGGALACLPWPHRHQSMTLRHWWTYGDNLRGHNCRYTGRAARFIAVANL